VSSFVCRQCGVVASSVDGAGPVSGPCPACGFDPEAAAPAAGQRVGSRIMMLGAALLAMVALYLPCESIDTRNVTVAGNAFELWATGVKLKEMGFPSLPLQLLMMTPLACFAWGSTLAWIAFFRRRPVPLLPLVGLAGFGGVNAWLLVALGGSYLWHLGPGYGVGAVALALQVLAARIARRTTEGVLT
jgi:hypothetical protein